MFVRGKLFTHEQISISCFAQTALFCFSDSIASYCNLVKMGTQVSQ